MHVTLCQHCPAQRSCRILHKSCFVPIGSCCLGAHMPTLCWRVFMHLASLRCLKQGQAGVRTFVMASLWRRARSLSVTSPQYPGLPQGIR